MASDCAGERVTARRPHWERTWAPAPGFWSRSCEASPGHVSECDCITQEHRLLSFAFQSLPSVETPVTPLRSPPWLHSTREANFLNTQISNRFTFFFGNYKALCDPQKWFNSGVHKGISSQQKYSSTCVFENHCLKCYWNPFTEDLK